MNPVPVPVVGATAAHEAQALSGVLFILDACLAAAAFVVAVRLALDGWSHRLVLWSGNVVLGVSATVIGRAAVAADGTLIERWAPVASLVLVLCGHIGAGWSGRPRRSGAVAPDAPSGRIVHCATTRTYDHAPVEPGTARATGRRPSSRGSQADRSARRGRFRRPR